MLGAAGRATVAQTLSSTGSLRQHLRRVVLTRRLQRFRAKSSAPASRSLTGDLSGHPLRVARASVVQRRGNQQKISSGNNSMLQPSGLRNGLRRR